MRFVVAAAALALALGSVTAIAQEVPADQAPAIAALAPVPEDQAPTVDAALAPGMHTGLSGRVVLASRCPVPLGGDDSICPSVPLATALTVRSADGSAEVARVATDADGQFSVPLDPGQYTVLVQAPGGGTVFTVCPPPTHLVRPGPEP